MSQVVESVAVAAPRGLVWRVIRELATQHADSRVVQPEVVREARELTWASSVFVEVDGSAEHRVDMHWWARLAPGWTGTEVEHGCAFSGRHDLLAPVRARLLATLTEVKARAEAQSAQ